MKGASYLLAGEPFHLTCESSSLVLVKSPWGSCSLLVSTDFPNTGLPVSRKTRGASHSARAGMCQLLLKEAILVLIPGQGIGRAGLFPTVQSTYTESHMTLKVGEDGWVKLFWVWRLALKPFEGVPGC